MIFPLTGSLAETEASVCFILRNRACLSVLLVHHYPGLSVPPDWGT